jgi:hypothetical protein
MLFSAVYDRQTDFAISRQGNAGGLILLDKNKFNLVEGLIVS